MYNRLSVNKDTITPPSQPSSSVTTVRRPLELNPAIARVMAFSAMALSTPCTFSGAAVLALASTLVFVLAKCTYNVLFHPLRHYPGPLLGRATRAYFLFWDVRGLSHWRVKAWHDRYGAVVRIAPDELSYASGEAWAGIYGFPNRADGTGNFPKDAQWWNKNVGGVDNILTADDAGHRRMRRLQSPAFSDRALQAQAGVLGRYTDLLIQRLREAASKDTVDINAWYSFATFDLVGDLAFGEPFHCLRDGRTHWFVAAVFDIFHAGTYLRAARRFPAPLCQLLLLLAVPRRLLRTREDQYRFGVERVDKRLRREEEKGEGEGRPDFMSHILQADPSKGGMTRAELYTAAQVLIVAGSETTATALTAATYFLAANPRTLAILATELRARFADEAAMTFTTNGTQNTRIPYLDAVLDEALRLCPPGPGTFPRVVPAGGRLVCGRWVPAGASVGVHHLSVGRAPWNFRDPDDFVPERWLGTDERYADDNRAACQPFSFGPRNCIGKNLAYAEMRMILARVVWNFDLRLCPESVGWVDRQRTYTTWHKTAMNVELRPVVR